MRFSVTFFLYLNYILYDDDSVLSADLVYVLLFPQLLLIIHWKKYCNSYGSIVSMITGFVFRILGMCMQLNQMLMKLLD